MLMIMLVGRLNSQK